jgi:hypothetical protein
MNGIVLNSSIKIIIIITKIISYVFFRFSSCSCVSDGTGMEMSKNNMKLINQNCAR